MTYYKVKPEYDQTRKYKYTANSNLCFKATGDILIANELYTPRERERLAMSQRYFERVEIPKSKIYFLFGARFAAE